MKTATRRLFAACAIVLFALAAGSGGTEARSQPAVRKDGRTVIHLPAADRLQFRQGMRVYLESIEGTIDGMTKHKMALVAKAAQKSGMGMVKDVSLETALGLPPEFVLMSTDTHEKFDDLAKTARGGGATKLEIMEKLGTILAACTSCHSAFRLTPH